MVKFQMRKDVVESIVGPVAGGEHGILLPDGNKLYQKKGGWWSIGSYSKIGHLKAVILAAKIKAAADK